MSTGANCTFYEIEPGKWYYILEEPSAPKQAWDWREYAFAYGPFASSAEAVTHLHRNHANPGGWTEQEYRADFTPDEVLANLIAHAMPKGR